MNRTYGARTKLSKRCGGGPRYTATHLAPHHHHHYYHPPANPSLRRRYHCRDRPLPLPGRQDQRFFTRLYWRGGGGSSYRDVFTIVAESTCTRIGQQRWRWWRRRRWARAANSSRVCEMIMTSRQRMSHLPRIFECSPPLACEKLAVKSTLQKQGRGWVWGV